MNGLAFAFMALGVLSALLGMAWGIQMSASGDHGMAPAHAHLNLLGWVSCAIFAVYYHAVPGAERGVLPKLHFGVAAVGLVLIVPGIALALAAQGDTLAKLGSVLTIAAMALFAAVVIRR